MSVLDILSEKKVINEKDITPIEREVNSTGTSLETILFKRGVTEEAFLEAASKYYGVPTHLLGEQKIPGEILGYIPEEAATHYKFVPLAIKDGIIEVGMIDPDNIEARDALNFISSKINLPFKIIFILERDFDKVMAMYKGLSEEVTKALSQLDSALGSADSLVSIDSEAEKGLSQNPNAKKGEIDTIIIEAAPITKIVATILRYATDGDASDIHIEHLRDNVRVRFRVDGVLNTSLVLPIKVHSAIVSRIKILSSMKLDEKRKPQDGRFSARIEGRKIDFRVSTFPTYYGEKVVMRILDHDKGVKKMEELGISEKNLGLIRKAAQRPFGLILISGPTGSGKTTTLYSMLDEFDKDRKNVLSLEDPIEYSIDGVNQSQVHAEIGYTFANGLRTTLRQDPDIIMVGEIRDAETAQLAIQAALTGHLVLATIHTNDAIGVIPRLLDMKVDPYLIAPTLILAIAQRLVSVLCPDSGNPVTQDEKFKENIEKQFADLPEKYKKEIKMGNDFFTASPGPTCPNGTRGRIAVMEVLEMDKDIEAVLLKGATGSEMTKVARLKGMITMKEDALIKASNRRIPFEEVIAL
ncbi:MAG: type II/IV secretion system protein [Candidatus Taylorbacteria bacterium]|nr:type II/IV secretion system protein [Candidatus Taylorbacteria bacterium]